MFHGIIGASSKGFVMVKVVINRCYGGFSLSREAVLRAREISGNPKWGGATIKGDVHDGGYICDSDFGYTDHENIPRHDPVLVQVVEELGTEAASGMCARLMVKETYSPAYRIDEYDGMERIETPDGMDWVYA